MGNGNHPRLGTRSPALAALILLICTLATALSAPGVGARQPSAPAAPELPALVFNPVDLANAGMPGYRLNYGQIGGTYDLAAVAGEWTDQTTNDDLQIMLEGFGLSQSYELDLRVVPDPADSRTDLDRDLAVSVHDFGNAQGAAEGLALLDQLSSTWAGVQRIEGTGPTTTNAVIVREPSSDPADPVAHVTLAIQVDRMIGSIVVIDYRNQEPTAQELETLAALLSGRITDGLTGSTPGLGNMALRLTDPEFESLYEIRLDQYQRRDGQDFAYASDDEADSARRSVAAGDATEEYAFNQFIQGLEAIDPALPYQFGWVTRLYQFANEQAASAWLLSRPNQIQAISEDPVQNIQVITGAPTAGDESISLAYVEGGDFPSKIYRTFLRVGDRAADIYLTSSTSDPFPEATIQRFASFQAQCLAGGCPDSVLITDVLNGVVPTQTPQSVPVTPEAQLPADLGALTLTPADLAALQMPNFGVGLAYTTFPDQWLESVVDYRGVPEDQVRAVVDGAGFVRRYDNFLGSTADPSNPSGGIGQTVVSYIVEFSSEAGAASVFGFLEDESSNPNAVDLPLAAQVGTRAEATQLTGQDPSTGQPYAQIDLTFQLGKYHAGVAVIDWQGQPVSLDQVESLAHRMFDRLSASPQDAPGLSNLALHVAGDVATTTGDHYLLVGGVAVLQYGESSEALLERQRDAADAAQIDSYRVQQQLSLGAGGTADDLTVVLNLTRHTDETAARSWMAEMPELVSTNPAFANAQFSQAMPFGDESVTYTLTSADGSVAYRSVAIRIGNLVAVINVMGSSYPPSLLVVALADAQTQCLRNEGCSIPFELPAGLR